MADDKPTMSAAEGLLVSLFAFELFYIPLLVVTDLNGWVAWAIAVIGAIGVRAGYQYRWDQEHRSE
jgi:hypothetical protein